MTEDEAKNWVLQQGHDASAVALLTQLMDLVIAENERQNLIAGSTIPQFWNRHIVDSAQLLGLAGPDQSGLWIDLGSGGGFPGLVVGCLRQAPLILVETRGLRAAFLQHCVEVLGLRHASVEQAKVERLAPSANAAYISARAFAPLDRTFALACHLGDENTHWLLPKGRNAQNELAIAEKEWQAAFHVEQSVTDPDSAIVVAKGLKRRHGQSEITKSVRSRSA